MIIPRLFYACFVTALVAVITAGPATAQDGPPAPPDLDPAAVAERCIGEIRDGTGKCVEKIEKTSDRATKGIEKLVENEKLKAAHRLAKKSVESVNSTARRCSKHINAKAERCAALLERLESPRLAQAVLSAAERSVARIGDARAAAVQAIRRALPPRDRGEPDAG